MRPEPGGSVAGYANFRHLQSCYVFELHQDIEDPFLCLFAEGAGFWDGGVIHFL